MAPPSKPPSPTKLSTSNPKPKSRHKSCPIAVQLNSASSSSAVADPPPPDKRTRDQPNVSICHCCGHRINFENPKDRLQPLDSVWRIVLLCRKCRKNVCSGQTCTYCFRKTGNLGEFFTCCSCERRIHGDCVSNYGNCTPWCHLGVGSESFSVCIDCWVPELLKNSVRICRRSDNKGRSKENGKKREVEKNVQSSCGAKVGKKKKNVEDSATLMTEKLNCSCPIQASHDAKLAIQLHRAITSSPKSLSCSSLSKNSCDLHVSSIRNWSGLSYKRSRLGKSDIEDKNIMRCANIAQNEMMSPLGDINSFKPMESSQGLICFKRDKHRKIWKFIEDNAIKSEAMCSQQDIGVSEASVCGNAVQNKGDRFGKDFLKYRRRRPKWKLLQENGMVSVSGQSNSLDNHGVNLKPEFFKVDDGGCKIGYQLKSDGTEMILPCGSYNVPGDRYLLKYGKRGTITNTSSGSSFQLFNNILNQNPARKHD